jgi:apyrase
VSTELVPSEFSRTLAYGNVSYNLYSHSFLDFGQVTHESRVFFFSLRSFVLGWPFSEVWCLET